MSLKKHHFHHWFFWWEVHSLSSFIFQIKHLFSSSGSVFKHCTSKYLENFSFHSNYSPIFQYNEYSWEITVPISKYWTINHNFFDHQSLAILIPFISEWYVGQCQNYYLLLSFIFKNRIANLNFLRTFCLIA